MSATRGEVYSALDSERAYQDWKWERPAEGATQHESIGEFLIYMEQYLNAAKRTLTNVAEPEGTQQTLDAVRKVTALGVVCMEVHGAPRRNGF